MTPSHKMRTSVPEIMRFCSYLVKVFGAEAMASVERSYRISVCLGVLPADSDREMPLGPAIHVDAMSGASDVFDAADSER